MTDTDVFIDVEESCEELQSATTLPEDCSYRKPTEDEFNVDSMFTNSDDKKASYLLMKDKDTPRPKPQKKPVTPSSN